MTVFELYKKLEELITEDNLGELDIMLDVDSGLYFAWGIHLDCDEHYNNYFSITGGAS